MVSSRTQSRMWRGVGFLLVACYIGLSIWYFFDEDFPTELFIANCLVLICGLQSWGLADVFSKLAVMETRLPTPPDARLDAQ